LCSPHHISTNPGPPQKFYFTEDAFGKITLRVFDHGFSRCGTWRQEERNIEQERAKVANAVWDKRECHESFLGYLQCVLIGEQAPLVEEFRRSLQESNKDKFVSLFNHLPRSQLYDINDGEELQVLVDREFVGAKPLTKQDEAELQSYMQESGFTGVVSIAPGQTSIQAVSGVA